MISCQYLVKNVKVRHTFSKFKTSTDLFASSLIKENLAEKFLQGVGNTCLQGGGAGAGQEGGADTGHPRQERRQRGGDQTPGSSLTLFTWGTKFEKSSHCYPIGEIK